MLKKPQYRTSLTHAQWQIVEPLLRKRTRRGRPLKHSRRSIIDAIIYLLCTGRQWRMLPNDFPPWEAVYQVFYRWREDGT